MATRMQQRRGTASQWTTANPVLGAGEIGFETNTGKFKIGDGSTAWSSLNYYVDANTILGGVSPADLPAALDTLNELAAALGDDANYATTVTNALAAKAPLASPTFTGTVILPSTTSIGDVSATELGYLNNVSSAIQTQLDGKQATISGAATTIATSNLTANVALQSSAEGKVVGSSVTSNELSYLSGVTSAIQTQLNDKAATSALGGLAPTNNPTFTGNVTLPSTTTIGELSSTEIGYLSTVTSDVQTQLNAKADSGTVASTYAPLNNPSFTGTVSLPSTTSIGEVSSTEIGYVNGVTSAIQTQIDAKAPTSSPTFTGTVSGITATMVGLANVDNTSDANKPVSAATQEALNAKLSLSGGTMTGALTLSGAPTEANHAVNKAYADSIAEGLHVHASCVAATTANVNLSNALENGDVLDGVTLVTGDRVLVKNQSTASENGIYIVQASGAALRAPDFNEPLEVDGGDFVFITGGTVNDNTGWVQTATNVVTIGTDPITFVQFAGAGTITAGTNISVNGSEISVVNNPTFSGLVTAATAGVAFSDGTQTKEGVPSRTTIVSVTDTYNLSTGGLSLRDQLIECNKATGFTVTIPANSTTAYPVGTSIDLLQTGAGQVTIAGAAGVTVNATPGLKLRSQWSSATLFKRATDTWVVMGDLSA